MCCFSHRLKPLFQCALRLHGVPDFRGYGLLSFGTRPGVEGLKTSPSDTQNAGTHRFYRGRSSQRLALDVSFQARKKTCKKRYKSHPKTIFSCWLRRSNSLKQWMNKSFQFCFLLLCEILPMPPLPFGCFFLTLPGCLSKRRFFCHLPHQHFVLQQFLGSQSGRQMLPGWILTRYLSTWIIPKIAFGRLKVGTNIKMHNKRTNMLGSKRNVFIF